MSSIVGFNSPAIPSRLSSICDASSGCSLNSSKLVPPARLILSFSFYSSFSARLSRLVGLWAAAVFSFSCLFSMKTVFFWSIICFNYSSTLSSSPSWVKRLVIILRSYSFWARAIAIYLSYVSIFLKVRILDNNSTASLGTPRVDSSVVRLVSSK